ncbi:MAG: glucosyltransferase domain-containing protein [Endomicrobium sp.]|jgi:hypothetical protein|uniref:hypothetical protein n=1 Tax=Candidatus Endomicrobiellum cubanum TaxID=3242325 RepID=UPI00282737FF|nr:glucosyltransferase domain-containing protein [Endomicrobium sp.]
MLLKYLKFNNFKKEYFLYALIIGGCYSPVFTSSYIIIDDWNKWKASITAILKHEIMIGRFFNGLMLLLFKPFNTIGEICTIRFISVVTVVIYCCMLYNFIRKKTIIDDSTSFFLPLFSVFLPSFVVNVSFAAMFAVPTSLIFSLLSYNLIRNSQGEIKFSSKVVKLLFALSCIAISFNIYQISAMCFLVPLLLELCFGKEILDKKKIIQIMAILLFGMLLTFFVISFISPLILQLSTQRTSLTTDFSDKILWFKDYILPYAVCNFAIAPSFVYKIFSWGLFSSGFFYIVVKKGLIVGSFVIFMIIMAYSQNLIVEESVIYARTFSAISMLCLVIEIIGLNNLLNFFGLYTSKIHRIIFSSLLLAVVIITQKHIQEQFVLPSKIEYYSLYKELNSLPKGKPVQVIIYSSSNWDDGLSSPGYYTDFVANYSLWPAFSALYEVEYIIKINKIDNIQLYKSPFFTREGENEINLLVDKEKKGDLYIIDTKNIIQKNGNMV